MMNHKHSLQGFGFVVGRILTVGLFISTSVFAAPPASRIRSQPAPAPAPAQPANLAAPQTPDSVKVQTSDTDEAGTLPERIDVQQMKRRYWTVGNEDLMDVVQNRRYTKKGRFEFALRYGFWSDDSFQDQKSTGASLGYHINEFLSIHGFYSSVSASNNQAFKAARETSTIDPVTNPAKSVMGAEARGSLIYGKLSLLGNKIIYYDFNTALGLSQHKATQGSSTGFFLGLGQQFFLNRTWFVGVDWRLMFHTDKFVTATTTNRSLTTSWIQIGVGVFFP